MFLSVSSLDTVPRSDPSRRESRQHPPAWSPCRNAVVASLRRSRVSARVTTRIDSTIEYRVSCHESPADGGHPLAGAPPQIRPGTSRVTVRPDESPSGVDNLLSQATSTEREPYRSRVTAVWDDTAVIDCNGHTSESEPALLETS